MTVHDETTTPLPPLATAARRELRSGTSDPPERGAGFRLRVGAGAAVVLVIAVLVVSVLVTALSPVGATTIVASGPSGTPSAPPVSVSSHTPSPSLLPSPVSPVPSVVTVHVLGAVGAPGVYELPVGSRVVDGVEAAGGLAESADAGSVNLARPLVDGEQLRVLSVGEEVPRVPTGPEPGASGAAASVEPAAGAGAGALIDLNRATAMELESLPRIGPAMAARIVEWRDQNGGFSAVDDLLQITGIGDKTFEGLRDLVTV
ncbi:ComEA family DNA-binding protein [Herbiconiux moechotypicola]|uniref:Helix-hairpin-helix DNA-binding motif class 1 domain-containing protein n=1 Tax=Herbiconiux moechotypicola TaxID=637393 RepID=A0ABP5QGG3_9MICO|nr:ComEA family DNA-binding protein [Herbiconiux moechotypicola]MCS5729859.1 ComEA family DNA-binding protein [Herbiconiux moechotypicola]